MDNKWWRMMIVLPLGDVYMRRNNESLMVRKDNVNKHKRRRMISMAPLGDVDELQYGRQCIANNDRRRVMKSVENKENDTRCTFVIREATNARAQTLAQFHCCVYG